MFGFFMAWGVGANDVANAMGTSVGSGALTVRQAILIAMVFEFAGAWLAGGEVTSTIRKGIIDMSFAVDSPHLLIYGMASLFVGRRIVAADCHTLGVGLFQQRIQSLVLLSDSAPSASLQRLCNGVKWALSSPVGSSLH